ncbi:hypothetical protein ROTO_09170 [Roseovarius tolerans]|uniref:Uncharacterized protein n=1 Tax=Roseovarius tolerans TaxID=74031 RepID=A0A0L6CY42_9RHOB|nr:hypothetical protein ROTO_09170 [Roseovarius tolerans]
MRQERFKRAPRLGTRLVDHARRQIGAATAERATGGICGDYLIAGPRQHAQRSARNIRLHPAVERVGEENDLARLGRGAGALHLGIAEIIAAKHWQGTCTRQPGDAFTQGGQKRRAVAQGDETAQCHGEASIARHLGDQAGAQTEPKLLAALIEHLGLHFGHVHAGGAFALAGLAADAQLHRLGHLVGKERVLAQSARQRKPQCVGAAPRHVALIAGHAVAGTHRAARQLAAGAVVVAHLDRALKATALAGPGGPVVPRLEIGEIIARRIAHQAAVIHFRRMHDLAGIEAGVGIERRLDLFEGAQDARAEHRAVKLGAHDTVAMLAGMRALVVAHHLERGFGDLAHLAHVLFQLEVEHRAHVQAPLGGVGIPCAGGAVLMKDLCQTVSVIRQMIKRHGAILDEGHGLSLVLHRHHDVEPRLAQLSDLGGKGHVPDLDHAAFVAVALAEAIAQI